MQVSAEAKNVGGTKAVIINVEPKQGEEIFSTVQSNETTKVQGFLTQVIFTADEWNKFKNTVDQVLGV